MRNDPAGSLITLPNRDPRIAVGIIYATGSIYITNRLGISNVPGNVIHGALKDLSASSQTIYPDEGRTTIGTLSFSAVDIDGDLTDDLRTQLLTNERGLGFKEIRVYTGDTDDFQDWQYQRVDTYVVTRCERDGNTYRFRCSDRSREQRVQIFEQATTRLDSTITASATTINVVDTTGFETLEHLGWFTDSPDTVVGYALIEKTGEIFSYTGLTGTSFTGVTRGLFNTVAQPVTVEASSDDRKPEIIEFIYLEMPAPVLDYALKTGKILNNLITNGYGERGTSGSLPTGWTSGGGNDLEVAEDESRYGSRSMKIDNSGGASNSYSYQDLSVVAGEAYRVSGWIKTTAMTASDAGHGATLNIDPVSGVSGFTITSKTTDGADPGASEPDIGIEADDDAHDWTYVECVFVPTGSDGTIRLYCVLGNGGIQDGIAWFDDVRVEKVISLPDSWHMGIDESHVNRYQYETVGSDLYDPDDDSEGMVLRFTHLEETDGKRFVEEQLHVPMGTVPTISTYGVIGIKRVGALVNGASPVVTIDDGLIVRHSALRHELQSVINQLVIDWNYNGDAFTRSNLLINSGSVSTHGKNAPRKLELRGLHVSRHSSQTVQRVFDYFVERYGAPPLSIDVQLSRGLNQVEVGDIVQLQISNMRDFSDTGVLDRPFEVQSRRMNWRTGELWVNLFASTSRTIPDAGGGTSAVLPDSYYASEGTELSTVLTISGGAVTSSGSLTGGEDLRATVYYYAGDLTINAGVTVTIGDNVQLRIRGTLTVNGSIDGAGNGHSGYSDNNVKGAIAVSQPSRTAGYLGSSYGGGGLAFFQFAWHATPSVTVTGQTPVLPRFDIAVQSNALAGLPADLRGAPGAPGGVYITPTAGVFYVAEEGGDGGDGGAGLLIVCRGLAFGASGEIDLSGSNGSGGTDATLYSKVVYSGGGGGGAPGGLYVMLDGDSITYPDIASKFIANQGSTVVNGTPMNKLAQFNTMPSPGSSYYPPIAAADRWQTSHVVHYVPSGIELGESDDEIAPAPTGLATIGTAAGVLVSWVSPPAGRHDFVELWSAPTNDRSGATRVWSGKGDARTLTSDTAITRYFWVRAVKEEVGYSDWHPLSSTAGVSASYGGLERPRNLLQMDSWTAGSIVAGVGNFVANYTTTGENEILNAIGPRGTSQLVWQGQCADPGFGSGGEANGGWNNEDDLQGLDSSRSYRAAVWAKRTADDDVSNSFYFGCDYAYGSTYDLGGGVNGNPYFVAATLGVALPVFDKWYLVVGIVHGDDYAGGDTGQSGVYDPDTGQRVVSGVEFRMAPGATIQSHRTYMYYGGNTDVRLQWADPRFEVIDGNEPPLSALLDAGRALDWRRDLINDDFSYVDAAGLYQRWVSQAGGVADADIALLTGLTGVPGGTAIRIGNNSGDDMLWAAFTDYLMPYDPDSLYEVGVIARRVTGSGTFFCGLEGVADDQVTLINVSGGDSYSSQHYIAAGGVALASSFTAYRGYVRGHDTTAGGQANDPSEPAAMYAGVAFIRPLFIANYNGAAGQTDIAAIWVRRIGGSLGARDTAGTDQLDEDAATEVYSIEEFGTEIAASTYADEINIDVDVDSTIIIEARANSMSGTNPTWTPYVDSTDGQPVDGSFSPDVPFLYSFGYFNVAAGNYDVGMRADVTSGNVTITDRFVNIIVVKR